MNPQLFLRCAQLPSRQRHADAAATLGPKRESRRDRAVSERRRLLPPICAQPGIHRPDRCALAVLRPILVGGTLCQLFSCCWRARVDQTRVAPDLFGRWRMPSIQTRHH